MEDNVICRLCLKNLNDESAVLLFGETKSTDTDKVLVKMISDYLFILLSENDAISTKICVECRCHLEDFHKFWVLVENQQNTIFDKSIQINCDVRLITTDDDDANGVAIVTNSDVNMDINVSTPSSDLNVVAGPVELSPPEIAVKSEQVECQMPQIGEEPMEIEEEEPSEEVLCAINTLPDVEVAAGPLPAPIVQQENNNGTGNDEVPIAKTKSKRSNTNAKFKLNEKIVANYMKLNCEICYFEADTFTDLRLHFNEVHKKVPYVKCCDVVFHRLSRLVEHVRWHQNPDEFRCQFCQKVMRSKTNLRNHTKIAHIDELDDDEIPIIYPCTKCRQKFVSQKRLDSHMSKHLDEPPTFNCEICHDSFSSIQLQRQHFETKHKNKKHSYSCTTCGQRFKSQSLLERHMLQHQGDLPVQCLICGAWQNNKESLRRHKLTHAKTDNKKNQCELCGKECSTRTSLYGHIQSAHKTRKKFPCQYCEKSFKMRRYLDEHLATHTGVKLHTCPHCTTEFRCKSNMYAHIKRKHIEEWMWAKELRSANGGVAKPSGTNIIDVNHNNSNTTTTTCTITSATTSVTTSTATASAIATTSSRRNLTPILTNNNDASCTSAMDTNANNGINTNANLSIDANANKTKPSTTDVIFINCDSTSEDSSSD